MLETKDIQVVILLGGLGTRLVKEASFFPKAMVNVCGRPFLYYQLNLMRWCGFRKFLFCVGYKGIVIKNYFGNGKKLGISIKYSDEGDNLLGTAGALRKASHLLENNFMLIYGDSYMDVDYNQLLYSFDKTVKSDKSLAGLMAILKNRNKYDKSNVVFRNNKLLKYDKKIYVPSMEYIDYGIAILKKRVVSGLAKGKHVGLSEIYSRLVQNGGMSAYEIKNRFREIGTSSSLNEFRRFTKERLLEKRPYIFLDRDGTLNEQIFNKDSGQFDSPLSPDKLRLLPGVIKALRIFKKLGYGLIVVTNQPAAAKGKAKLSDIYAVNNRLRDELIKAGIFLDDLLMCIHHPVGTDFTKEKWLITNCDCRKPKSGLLKRAFKKFAIAKSLSFVVGDSYTDVLLAKKVKLRSAFIGDYKCEGCRILGKDQPDFIVKSLLDFAKRFAKIAREV